MNLNASELNTLYRYALALVQDEARAYDLVHSALVKALPKQPDHLMSYMRVSIRNLYFDEYRREKNFRQELLDEASPDVVQMQAPSIEDIYVETDELEQVLGELDPRDRELLYLYAVEEMTFEEIAQQTGQKRGSLLSRMHRLREKLKGKEEKNGSST